MKQKQNVAWKVNLSIAFMVKHLNRRSRNRVTVERLAKIANLSASHYSASFRRTTGYSPVDFFIRLQMHQACLWLQTSNLTVKGIGAKLGYKDQFYFSRLFKSFLGTPPTQYRLLGPGVTPLFPRRQFGVVSAGGVETYADNSPNTAVTGHGRVMPLLRGSLKLAPAPPRDCRTEFMVGPAMTRKARSVLTAEQAVKKRRQQPKEDFRFQKRKD